MTSLSYKLISILLCLCGMSVLWASTNLSHVYPVFLPFRDAEFTQCFIACWFLIFHGSLYFEMSGWIFPYSTPFRFKTNIFSMESPYFEDPRWAPCYVMQAVISISCLGDKNLLHAKLMSTALTQLLIFRFSCLLTNKRIVQCIDNSNNLYKLDIYIYLLFIYYQVLCLYFKTSIIIHITVTYLLVTMC